MWMTFAIRCVVLLCFSISNKALAGLIDYGIYAEFNQQRQTSYQYGQIQDDENIAVSRNTIAVFTVNPALLGPNIAPGLNDFEYVMGSGSGAISTFIAVSILDVLPFNPNSRSTIFRNSDGIWGIRVDRRWQQTSYSLDGQLAVITDLQAWLEVTGFNSTLDSEDGLNLPKPVFSAGGQIAYGWDQSALSYNQGNLVDDTRHEFRTTGTIFGGYYQKQSSGVPEPAAIGLLGIGVLALAARRRQKIARRQGS